MDALAEHFTQPCRRGLAASLSRPTMRESPERLMQKITALLSSHRDEHGREEAGAHGPGPMSYSAVPTSSATRSSRICTTSGTSPEALCWNHNATRERPTQAAVREIAGQTQHIEYTAVISPDPTPTSRTVHHLQRLESVSWCNYATARDADGYILPPTSDYHPKRGTSVCSAPQYTSPNGLEFQVHCGQAFGGNTTVHSGIYDSVHNVVDCMIRCSQTRPRCYGVAFDSSDLTCWWYDAGSLGSNFGSNDNVDVAIAHATQLQSPGDLSCPYPDNSFQILDGGEKFVIDCEQDFPFGDYCPWNLLPSSCPAHADTMEGCLEICSRAHPLCLGISWNPDMIAGYANCYLKNDPTAGQGRLSADYVVHSARVIPPDVAGGCPANKAYTAKNGHNFTIGCWDSRIGSQNITSQHESQVDGCMDSCANHLGQGCVGVIFDFNMQKGFDKCYLLNATGSHYASQNMTFPQLTQSRTINTSAGQSDYSHGSLSWIAGVVLGIIILLRLLLGGIYWWRRRYKRQAPAQTRPGGPAWDNKFMAKTSDTVLFEMQNGERRPYELQDPKSEQLLQHELQDPKSEQLLQHELSS